MKHPLTAEQEAIVSHVCAPNAANALTLVDSVAGSGKTSLLVAIATRLPAKEGIYLAYNKAVATESQRKFPSTIKCMTTHSLAYGSTVVPLKLKLGTFSHREIKEKIKYEQKWELINSIRSFCLSRFLSYADYAADNQLPKLFTSLANKYLDQMQSGTIECTHDFYLKLFHIMLANGSIQYDPFGFIMLDEAGDLNEVTLEIFRLLPSDRKIAVGDKHQNIYQFNDTINCFNVLAEEGTTMHMTKSFRVSDIIAKKVQKFCSSYLSPGMTFKGTVIKDKTITTRAYLTRTNGELVNKMITLNADRIPYSLVRRAADIFKVPLMLCNLKYQGFITDPAYKFLQEDVDHWYEDATLRDTYKSVMAYLMSLYEDDVQLSQAIRLVQRHRKALIIDTYEEARKHEKARHPYTLATVHSCKGAEFDEVTIADDLNDSVEETIFTLRAGRALDTLSPKELESLNLYYVSITRAAKELYNARHI